jgi:hypothetical protein
VSDPEAVLIAAFCDYEFEATNSVLAREIDAEQVARHALNAFTEAGYIVVKRSLVTRNNREARSERLVAATELRHVTTMLDVEQIPFLSPLAAQQVRVAIGFLQQQAAEFMDAARSEEGDSDA